MTVVIQKSEALSQEQILSKFPLVTNKVYKEFNSIKLCIFSKQRTWKNKFLVLNRSNTPWLCVQQHSVISIMDTNGGFMQKKKPGINEEKAFIN